MIIVWQMGSVALFSIGASKLTPRALGYGIEYQASAVPR